MSRVSAYERALRVLGTGILVVFVVGSSSGPLRTCFSHLGHEAGGPAASAHRTSTHAGGHALAAHGAVAAHSEGASESGHEGCSCLGRCSLEHAPYLPGSNRPAVAHAAVVPKSLTAGAVRAPAQRDPLKHPLARPPPAVV